MADALPAPPPIGWPLLPLPGTDGRMRYPTYAQSVRQSIQVILRRGPASN